jgi:hypothetical protein
LELDISFQEKGYSFMKIGQLKDENGLDFILSEGSKGREKHIG